MGKEKLESNEPPPPAGEWDPTICIVGDMKQSIYRFRQAEVTVMRRAVGYIRQMNSEVLLMENRLHHILDKDSSRDPRPIPGKGGESSTFEVASKLASSDAKRPDRISFALDDFDKKLPQTSQDKRAEGHIEMSTNYRTSPKLLHAMNDIFQDTFDSRHHTLPAHGMQNQFIGWQKGFDDGKLEWILPARTSELRLEMNPSVPKDPFVHEGSNDLELCADLLAKRYPLY